MTQRDLAARAGTTQSAIARIESGRTAPSFDRIVALVRACGFDLDIHVVALDEDAWTLGEQGQRQTPDQRLDSLLAGVEFVQAGRRARKGEG